jgi:hypothetical protein
LAQIGFYSALAGLAFLSAQSVALAEEPIPDVLRRVAPAVVQIRMGDDLTGSGFVYPTPRHVTRSRDLSCKDRERGHLTLPSAPAADLG